MFDVKLLKLEQMSIREPLSLQREKSEPSVTVLMSVYNGEKYLREAVNSVLNQTFRDFEFLIINDFSTDGTAAILKSYDDPRIRLINNEENMGLTRSLNKGLKLARGRYVARMDADDISLAERLEKQAIHLDTHPEVALVGSMYEIIDGSGKSITTCKSAMNSESIYYTSLFFCCIAHSSAMFRKDLVQELGGYDVTLRRAQDADLWYRITRRFKVDVLHTVLIKWRETESNISNYHKTEQDTDAKQIFVKNVSELTDNSVEIEKISCFHDEGFPERQPLNVNAESLLELEKIQRIMIAECPTSLSIDELKTYCDQKLQGYLFQMIRNAQLIEVVKLMRYPKFRADVLAVLKSGILRALD